MIQKGCFHKQEKGFQERSKLIKKFISNDPINAAGRTGKNSFNSEKAMAGLKKINVVLRDSGFVWENIGSLRNFQRCVDGRKKYLKMWKRFETHVKGYWVLYQNLRSPATELCAYVQVWTISLCVQRTQTLQSFLSIWRYCRTGRWESYAVTYLPIPANTSFKICNQIPFAACIFLLIR